MGDYCFVLSQSLHIITIVSGRIYWQTHQKHNVHDI